MDLTPFTLRGRHTTLEPLSAGDLDALWSVARDPDLWRLSPTRVASRDDLARYLSTALAEQRAGRAVPFVTRLTDGPVVGSTRFANIVPEHRRVEIGWTWIGRPWQRTIVNTEAKYLMLRHAFEHWGCIRVELKTSSLNLRSQNAILRIGAVPEGTFRSHVVNHDGSRRDTVWFSILDHEWPAVKVGLEQRMREANR